MLQALLGACSHVYGGPPAPSSYPETATDFLRLSTWDASTTTEKISQTFSPADVVLAGNRIALPDLGFAAPVGTTTVPAVRCFFESTGTLPTDANTGQPLSGAYFLSPNGSGGYDVYPECNQSNWHTYFPNIPHAVLEESAMPAQNYVQQVNKVIFSDQGTGTHKVYTNNLLNQMPNLITGGAAVSLQTVNSNKHNRFEIVSINGKDALDSRYLLRDPAVRAVYNLYGMSATLSPNSGAAMAALDAALRGKRCVYQIWATKVENSNTFGLAKLPLAPASVNTSTGVISFATHGFSTGWQVIVSPVPGGVIPNGYSGTLFVRSASANTVTLHPSLADATNNTNIIIPTTQGSGGFTLIANQRPSDDERMRFFAEVRDSTGGNTATTRFNSLGAGDGTLVMSSDIVVSGAGNGNMGATGRAWVNMVPNTATDIAYMYIWIPTACVAPTCVDTGLPLSSGYYWITRTPSSSVFVRLFRNLPDAQASLGLTSNNTNCIKFNGVAGSGFIRGENTQRPLSISVEGAPGASEKYIMFPSTTAPMVYANIIDRDDPTATGVKEYHYINGTLLGVVDTGVGKGISSSTPSSTNPITMLNSPAWHVPFEGKVWDVVVGSSAGAVVYADISDKVDYFKASHGVA